MHLKTQIGNVYIYDRWREYGYKDMRWEKGRVLGRWRCETKCCSLCLGRLDYFRTINQALSFANRRTHHDQPKS